MQVVKPTYEILEYTDLKLIESAGRTCYKSEDKIDENSAPKFVTGLVKRKHEAMIEHSLMTVRFICDRGVSHELVRHRLASFAQESTRYCNYSGDKFGNEITVIDLATGFHYNMMDSVDTAKYNEWQAAMKDAEDHYMKLIELGASPQEARSVLPTSTKTEVVMSCNFREWRHFFKLRAIGTTGKPHPQMVELAESLLAEVKNRIPVIFDDLTV